MTTNDTREKRFCSRDYIILVEAMKSVRFADSNRGMTLIEVMISLLLLSIVMGSIFAGLIQARFLARATAHQANAMQIARSNIEALRHSFGYADATLSVTGTGQSHTNMPSDLPQVLTVGNMSVGVNYAPSYTVKETTLAGSNICYKTVNFVVSWDEQLFLTTKRLSVNADTVIASVLDR